MTPENDISRTRFRRAAEIFEELWSGGARAGHESHLEICGAPARLRIAGDVLASRILAPLAHLAAAAGEPRLTIDLWDERDAGVTGLPAAEEQAQGRAWTLGDGVFAASPDGRIVSHQLRRSIAWLDRGAERIVGWFAAGDDLSLHQRGKPLQMLLALWASDRGVQAVHAGMVARDGAGVLVPARSGAGKSTSVLACLAAGYTCLGDDWIGIGAGGDGGFVAHGLYGSTSLEAEHARRFAALEPHLIPPTDANERKSLVLLAPLFPQRLGTSARLCALALPRIVDRAEAAWRPASKRDAILMLAPSAVFAMRPRAGREEVERLAEIAERVPAYWLELGRDLETIPRCMGEILAAAGGAARR